MDDDELKAVLGIIQWMVFGYAAGSVGGAVIAAIIVYYGVS